MKKLSILTTILAVAILSGCVKELKPDSTGNDNALSATAKPAPPPPVPFLQWQYCFGSSANDFGYSIAGNSAAYFIAGYTEGNNGNVSGNHGGQDALVIKTGLDGLSAWQNAKAIGGTGSDQANAIVATSDGGCLVAGQTYSNDGDVIGNHGGGDALLVKLSSSGAIEWEKTIGGSGYDRAWALITTADGGYALAGQTSSSDGDLAGVPGSAVNNNSKVWLVKFNNATNIEWQTTIAFDGAKDDVGYSITEAADHGFTIAGRTLSMDNNADICVANVNSSGSVIWRKTIGSNGGSGDVAWGVATCPANDGYVLTGYTAAYSLIVAKFYNNGDPSWQKIFAGSTSGGLQGKAILPNSQGYLITGVTSSKSGDIIASKGSDDMFALQIDASGNKIDCRVLGGKGYDMSRAVLASADGSYVGTGQTDSNNGDVSGNHGLWDVWLVKFKF
ncbi:MAG TPA: hypothetical protein VFD24_02990 [Chitinophagaceae bacterium]|jgi:hypothetical protein|nr:hypothetical protein [Chitinophagaceae bacterium]